MPLTIDDTHDRLLTGLAELAQAAGTADDLQTIFRALVRFVENTVPFNGMFVSLLDRERAQRRCVFAWSDGQEEDVSALPPLPMTDSPNSRAVQTGQVVITNDLQTILQRTPHVDIGLERDPGLPQSSIAVPMIVSAEVIGGFEVQTTQPNAYRPDDANALQMAAHIAAVAVRNADLVASLQQALDASRRMDAARQALLEGERASRAEAEHLAAERSAILGQIAEGIIMTDAEGCITFVNERARDIHDGASVLGVGIDGYSEAYHLLTMDGRPHPADELPLARAVLNGETVIDARWRIRRRDGTEAVAEGSAAPVLGPGGERLGSVLALRDVTAQHDLETQKSAFLAIVAHDLRTPLTTIKGRVQLLRRLAVAGSLRPEQLRSGLERVEAGATRMTELISQLLDLANTEIGRALVLSREPTDLVALVEAVVEDWCRANDDTPIEFQSALPSVHGEWDPERLQRVIVNLLSNAVKYTPGRQPVVVRVGLDEASMEAVLTVQDQGIGIPPEEQDRVFERYYRAANVSSTVPGTGIGLTAAQDIVSRHEGRIEVQSIEGQGTVVTVRLPSASPPR